MKKHINTIEKMAARCILCGCGILTSAVLTGCGSETAGQAIQQAEDTPAQVAETSEQMNPEDADMLVQAEVIVPEEQIVELEEGLSVVRFEGNDGFQTFLANGGAASDGAVVEYITKSMFDGAGNLIFKGTPFGCSTISAQTEEGTYLFGRNFDWYNCNALIVASYPEDAYASISTVNSDFITRGAGSLAPAFSFDNIMTVAALYAPLDGINEKGLSVSVNMIQDADTIDQNTDRPDITTTTAIRLLLNQAATVEEAVALLEEHDLHASFGLMIHLALSDATGRSVVVEYVNQEMVVTETPVVTNFYLSEGEKYGIGTSQSHDRYETLMTTLQEQSRLSEVEVRDALDSVSKHNYNDGETTEWSAIFNKSSGEAVYFHRENFDKAYRIQLNE